MSKGFPAILQAEGKLLVKDAAGPRKTLPEGASGDVCKRAQHLQDLGWDAGGSVSRGVIGNHKPPSFF